MTVSRKLKISLHIRVLTVLIALLITGCASVSLVDKVISMMAAYKAPTVVPSAPIIEAVYLPFRNGFMVYIEGESCLYAYADQILIPRAVSEAFGNYRYCLPFADTPETSEVGSAGPFDQIWLLYDQVADALGQPTGNATRYVTSIPPSDPVMMGGIFYGPILTLPDGTMLYCGMRAATAGTCQLRSS